MRSGAPMHALPLDRVRIFSATKLIHEPTCPGIVNHYKANAWEGPARHSTFIAGLVEKTDVYSYEGV